MGIGYIYIYIYMCVCVCYTGNNDIGRIIGLSSADEITQVVRCNAVS